MLCNVLYDEGMIKSFKHKGLELFYFTGKAKGIQQKHVKKLRNQLYILNAAVKVKDIDLPGYNLHQLRGSRKEYWSIVVNGNWRLTFKFEKGDVFILNYEDYH